MSEDPQFTRSLTAMLPHIIVIHRENATTWLLDCTCLWSLKLKDGPDCGANMAHELALRHATEVGAQAPLQVIDEMQCVRAVLNESGLKAAQEFADAETDGARDETNMDIRSDFHMGWLTLRKKIEDALATPRGET